MKTPCLLVLSVVAMGAVLHVHSELWKHDTRTEGEKGEPEDVYYLWIEGRRILAGENPYARVLSGDMRENRKYATYFPLFYLLSSATQGCGLQDYAQWLSFWRWVFMLFNLGVGLLLFRHFYRHGLVALAVFAFLFWTFNRWTLHVAEIAHIDFIPIFFLVASILAFPNSRQGSLVLLSLSLATKQIAVILVPLYLIWVWQSPGKRPVRNLVLAVLVIMSVPTVLSLPFVVWNAKGFFKSMLFSLTRFPMDHFSAPSLDAHLGLVGIPAKGPLLLLLGLVYLGALRRTIGMYTSMLAAMCVFIDFHSVLFRQYMCWVVPFIPLCVWDRYRQDAARPATTGANPDFRTGQ